MSSVDLDRLKHLAEQGDLQAAQTLLTYATRSEDTELLWYLEGLCRARIERLAIELETWRTFSKVFPTFAVPFSNSDVILEHCGPNKINCIKTIRELTHLGLKDAKDLSEQTPSIILRAATPAQAQDAYKRLTETGAEVRIGPGLKEMFSKA